MHRAITSTWTLKPDAMVLAGLLTCGERELTLFGDGTFSNQLHFGAWSWRVPALALNGTGSSDGAESNRFEMLAVLSGLECVNEVDRSRRCVHIKTDSEYVISLFRTLGACVPDGPLLKPSSSIRDLMERAGRVIRVRRVRCSRCNAADPDHQACHTAARRQLRECAASDGRLGGFKALARQERRLADLLAEKASLEKRLDSVDAKLLLCHIQVSALREYLSPAAPLERISASRAVQDFLSRV